MVTDARRAITKPKRTVWEGILYRKPEAVSSVLSDISGTDGRMHRGEKLHR